MKKLPFIIFLCFSPLVFFAQGTWTQMQNLGGLSRNYAAGFSIGTKGYIGTGYTGTSRLVDFWEWDQSTNVWTQKTNFPGTARYYSSGFSIGSKGYLGIGGDNNGECQDFWEYDPALNTWTQIANFAGTARFAAVGFSIGTKGYISTGENNSIGQFRDLWEYNPSTGGWTQKALYPGNARYAATGFSIGTKGYVGTGIGTSIFMEFYAYDPGTNIWTQISSCPTGGTRKDAVGFSIGLTGYFGTGRDNNSTDPTDWYAYDPPTDTWTFQGIFPFSGRTGAVGFSIGTKGYVGTGFANATNTYTADLWEWAPNTVVTGIRSINYIIASDVYPNPSAGNFNVRFSLQHDEPVSIDLLDQQGKAVMNILRSEQTSAGEHSYPVDLTSKNISSGIYFVRLRSNGQSLVKKIIVD